MKRFEDLLNQSSFPLDHTQGRDEFYSVTTRQERARTELVSLLEQSSLHLWSLGDPIPTDRPRYLVGVTTWTRYDMKLLDRLNDVMTERGAGPGGPRVDVFDFDRVWLVANDATGQPLERIEQYLPGMRLEQIFHSPVAGYWEAGALRRTESGAAARQWLIEALGASPI